MRGGNLAVAVALGDHHEKPHDLPCSIWGRSSCQFGFERVAHDRDRSGCASLCHPAEGTLSRLTDGALGVLGEFVRVSLNSRVVAKGSKQVANSSIELLCTLRIPNPSFTKLWHLIVIHDGDRIAKHGRNRGLIHRDFCRMMDGVRLVAAC